MAPIPSQHPKKSRVQKPFHLLQKQNADSDRDWRLWEENSFAQPSWPSVRILQNHLMWISTDKLKHKVNCQDKGDMKCCDYNLWPWDERHLANNEEKYREEEAKVKVVYSGQECRRTGNQTSGPRIFQEKRKPTIKGQHNALQLFWQACNMKNTNVKQKYQV